MAEPEEIWWDRYTHLTPRIDDDRYQCQVPEWDEKANTDMASKEDKSQVQWDPNLLKNSDTGDSAIDQHLMFTRALCEQTPYTWNQEEDNGAMHLESDEMALRHLITHRNYECAKLNALSLIGNGYEENRHRWNNHEVDKMQVSRTCFDYRDHPSFRATYGSYEPVSEVYGYPKESKRSSSDSTKDSSSSSSRGNRNCNGTKKEWQLLQQECTKLLKRPSKANSNGDERPREEEIFELLEKAASLGSPDFLGDSFITSIQKQLKQLQTLASVARGWTAKVYDCLAAPDAAATPRVNSSVGKGSNNGKCSSGTLSSTDTLDVHGNLMKCLHKLKDEGLSKLPLIVARHKINGLKQAISNIDNWKMKSISILNAKKQSHIFQVESLLEEASRQPCLQLQPEFVTLTVKSQEAKNLARRLKLFLLPPKLRQDYEEYRQLSWTQFLDLEDEVNRIGFEFNQSKLFEDQAIKIKNWNQEANDAIKQTPDFKQLQKIIADGSNLAVDFSETLEQLKIKATKAMQWVEKARNVVPQKKTRKNADTEKVQYEDMKNMLEEVSDMNVEMKERNQMALVVETAEDWIGRVKQALNDNEESTVNSLQQLLFEAESIPVNMSELVLLQGEIKARKWSNTVIDNLEKGNSNLDGLHRLLKEANAIRDTMPLEARVKKSYKFEEEVKLQHIVNQADGWKVKVKKVLSVKHGADLDKLDTLLSEAKLIPVNLSSSIKQIEAMFVKVNNWKETYANEIEFCKNAILKASQESEPSQEEDSHEMAIDNPIDDANKNENNIGDDDEEEDTVMNKIDLSSLEKCIQVGERTGAGIDEIIPMKSLLESGKLWLDKTEKMFVTTHRSKRGNQQQQTSTQKLTEDEIRVHIENALKLPFEFGNQVTKLENNIQFASEWQQKARGLLQGGLQKQNDQSSEQTPSSQDEASSASSPSIESNELMVEFDEKLVEQLKLLMTEAEALVMFFPEEALISSFLSIYNWCQDAHRMLHHSTKKKHSALSSSSSSSTASSSSSAAKITTQSFDQLVSQGKTLLQSPHLAQHSLFQPLMHAATTYQRVLLALQSKILHWCGLTKKAVESSGGVTLLQATDLITAANEFPTFEDMGKWFDTLNNSFDWLDKAHSALNRTKVLDVNQFNDLITAGEKYNVDHSIMKRIKHQLKQAKAWRLKLKKTGIEKGKATTSQLRLLLPEASGILVDLSDELEVINKAVAQHCICRKGHADGLIMCTSCDVHYHKTCLGLEQLSSSSHDYVCTRCVLRALYVSTVGNMINICDRWACNLAIPLTGAPTLSGSTEEPVLSENVPTDEANGIKITVTWFKFAKEALFEVNKVHPISLSPDNIKRLQDIALRYNIITLPDVKNVLEGFDLCIWYYMASNALWNSPSIDYLDNIVTKGTALNIHHAALSTFEKLHHRAHEWQGLALAAMSVKAPQSFDKTLISKLRKSKVHLPVMIKEEVSLTALQDDGGKRHCICRGPSDGTFMIGCDICEGWFHGHCIGVDAAMGELIAKNESQFICPKCASKNNLPYQFAASIGTVPKVIEINEEDDDDDAKYSSSMKATWLAGLWPPGRLVEDAHQPTPTVLSTSANHILSVVSDVVSAHSSTSSSSSSLSSSSTSSSSPVTMTSPSQVANTVSIPTTNIVSNNSIIINYGTPMKRSQGDVSESQTDYTEDTKRIKENS